MPVDPLMLLDPPQQGGGSADVRPGREPEESFDSILEKRMNSDNKKSERTSAKSKTDHPEKESEAVEKTEETVGDIKTDATDDAAGTETVQNQAATDSQSETELDLTEEQLHKLAALLGISMEKLKNLELLLENKSGRLIAKTPDGAVKDLSALLGLKDNGKPAESSEMIARLATLLDMDEGEAEKFFKRLKVSSIEIKAEGKPTEKAISSGNQFGKMVSSIANEHGMETSSQNHEKENRPGQQMSFRTAMEGPAKALQTGNSTQTSEFQGTLNEVSTSKEASIKPTQAADSLLKARETRVMDQIVERVRILTLPNQTHARIALKPPSLGSVDIKIVMHENHATAAIVVESAAVKQTVEQNLDQLRAALSQHGISIDEMNVSVEQQDARSSNDGEPEGEDQYGGLNENGDDTAEQQAAGAVLEQAIMKAAYNSVFNITV